MKFVAASAIACIPAILAAPTAELSKRQSRQWVNTCTGPSRAPLNFRAFNLGGCNAQLTYDKDPTIAVQWTFDAFYADGSRATYRPFRNFDNFGVSDTFYPYLGNNYLTKKPGDSGFIAVHEFTSVCRGGNAPVAWEFKADPVDDVCTPPGYTYTSGRINVASGSRPAKVGGTRLRRVNDAGDFEVTWNAVSGATAYSVILEYPTGRDEVGNPFRGTRGERIRAPSTRAVVATGNRIRDDRREVIVHAVNSQGVWSFTNDVQPVVANF